MINESIVTTIKFYLQGYKKKRIEGLYRKAFEQLGLNLNEAILWKKDNKVLVGYRGKYVNVEPGVFYAPVDRIDDVLLEIYREKMAKLVTSK